MHLSATAGTLALVALAIGGCATAPPSITAVRTPLPAAVASSVRAGDTPADLSAILEPIIAQAGIPGVAAIVLRGDRVIAQGVAGVRRLGSPERITLDDQFEICSCAKAMTAALAALVIEDGRLHWDTTLGELFGDTLTDMNPAWKSVTLRQVLAHRAGFTEHLVLFARSTLFTSDSVSQQRLSYVKKLLARAPDYPPGTKFIYNSSDYVVVGAALEKITGRTWEELMQERLFQPLGITTAGFGPPGTPGQVDQPWGHGPRWLLYLPLPGSSAIPLDPGSRSADYPLAGAPGGLVHMSVPDWAKFVAWQLRGDAANPQRAATRLTPGSFAILHEPLSGESYAAGWFTGTRNWAKGPRPGDTGRVIFHQGDNGRWNADVWVAPEIDFALLIACNRTGMSGPVDEVAGALLRFASKPATKN